MARVVDLVEAGEIEAARREIAVASTIAYAVRQPRHRWVAASLHAMAAIFEGRLGDAERLALEAFDMGQRALEYDAPHALAAQLAIIRRCQGRHEEMMDASRSYAASRATAPVWGCFVAVSCAEMGRLEEARELLTLWSVDRCRRIPRDGNWLFGVTCLAEIPAYLGVPGPSRDLYDLGAVRRSRRLDVVRRCQHRLGRASPRSPRACIRRPRRRGRTLRALDRETTTWARARCSLAAATPTRGC